MIDPMRLVDAAESALRAVGPEPLKTWRELDAASREIKARANQLDAATSAVAGLPASMNWVGPQANAFGHAIWMDSLAASGIVDELLDLANDLHNDAVRVRHEWEQWHAARNAAQHALDQARAAARSVAP